MARRNSRAASLRVFTGYEKASLDRPPHEAVREHVFQVDWRPFIIQHLLLSHRTPCQMDTGRRYKCFETPPFC